MSVWFFVINIILFMNFNYSILFIWAKEDICPLLQWESFLHRDLLLFMLIFIISWAKLQTFVEKELRSVFLIDF